MPSKPLKQTTPPDPAGLFRARLLGYLVGLVPLVALLLMFRQVLPSSVALAVVLVGFMASVAMQNRVRQRYPYNFKARAEWLALGAYAAAVVAVTVVFLYIWK